MGLEQPILRMTPLSGSKTQPHAVHRATYRKPAVWLSNGLSGSTTGITPWEHSGQRLERTRSRAASSTSCRMHSSPSVRASSCSSGIVVKITAGA